MVDAVVDAGVDAGVDAVVVFDLVPSILAAHAICLGVVRLTFDLKVQSDSGNPCFMDFSIWLFSSNCFISKGAVESNSSMYSRTIYSTNIF